jgi:hypothetical protein
VTEKGIARFRDFLAKTRLEAAPILVDDEAGISSGRIDLRLKNTFDAPVEVTAEIDGLPLRGLSVEPGNVLKLSAAPGETQTLSVDVRFGEKIAFAQFAQTLLTAKIRTLEDDSPLSAERTVPVVIDRKYPCPSVAEPVVVDGFPKEWNELPLATTDKPLLAGEAEEWQGPQDASLRFATSHDDNFLYVAAEVTDEHVVDGDKLEFRFDARWIGERKSEARPKTGAYLLSIPAPSSEQAGSAKASKLSLVGSPKIGPADVATARTPKGWTVEAAIPLKMLTTNQSDKWHSFQMTPIVVDVDDAGEKPVQVIWRGTIDAATRNTNYGQFVRTK